jgi:hypothetical protein
MCHSLTHFVCSRPGGGKKNKTTRSTKKPQVSKSGVELLEEQTKRMEQQLTELRVRLRQDRSSHDQKVRDTGHGVRWAAARPSKNYMQEVMANSRSAAQNFSSRPGSRSGRNRGGSSSSANTSARTQPQQPRAPARRQGGNARALDPKRPQYIAPTNGPSRLYTQSDSAPAEQDGAPGSLLQGAYSEREASNAFAEARREWLSTSEPLQANSSNNTSSHGRSTARQRTVNKEIIPSNEPGSLSQGQFDESRSHDAFAAARKEWLQDAQGVMKNPARAQQPEENGASIIAADAGAAKNKVQVVRSSTSSTNVTRTRRGVEITPNVTDDVEIKQGSLLDGAFDERESHREFEDARRLWLDHSVEHFQHVGRSFLVRVLMSPLFNVASLSHACVCVCV